MPVLNKVEHIITTQHKLEEAFLAEYRAGVYTLEKPFVKLNPYGISPLTALVMFQTQKRVTATITVLGKEKEGNLTFTCDAETNHNIPVYGLYLDFENTVEIELSSGEKNTIKIQTEPALVEGIAEATYVKCATGYLEGELIFVNPSAKSQSAAYDYKGDLRWYSTIIFNFDIKRIQNGRLLTGTNRLLAPPYSTSGLFEMGMIGKIYKEYRIPGGYHHDQLEMEDGNLLILTQDLPRGTVEDVCVLVDRKTGDIIKTWDYQKVLPMDVAGSGTHDAHDWFHNNAVWYDKKTHSLTLSGRHQDAIINLNYETGDLNWIIGDPECWPQDMVDKYFFTPVGEGEFDWQYEQHACMVLPNGNIFVFDNGHYRAKKKENYVEAKDNFSRGVIYKIDTEAMTIEQVWQYGKERGSSFYSCYICNVEYYGPGHYMVHSGGTGFLDGVAVDAPPAMMVNQGHPVKMKSITVELKDDEIMFELHLNSNFYRAEKLTPYHANDKLTFGKGEILGGFGVAEEMETEVPAQESGMVPDKYAICFGDEEDRLIFKGSFEKGQLVLLQLEGEKPHQYFIPTTKRPFAAMCVGTFLNDRGREVEFYISKEGITGNYDVKLIIDDNKYETGISLSI